MVDMSFEVELTVEYQAKEFSLGNNWDVNTVQIQFRVAMGTSSVAKVHANSLCLWKAEFILVSPLLDLVEAVLHLSLYGPHVLRGTGNREVVNEQRLFNPSVYHIGDAVDFHDKKRMLP